MSFAVWAAPLLVGALLAGCADEAPPTCDAVAVDVACTNPLYPPTFAHVYDDTLKNGCGAERSACHSREGNQGGVSFETPLIAYTRLLQNRRIVPGDATCSVAIIRVTGVGHDYQMPPGDALPGNEQCALIQWVQAGAPGPETASGREP